MKDFSPVPGGASEKGSQTTPGTTAAHCGIEPTLSLVLKCCGWELPFLDVVLSKQSDAEQKGASSLPRCQSLEHKVVVRLITTGATKISAFLCVYAACLPPSLPGQVQKEASPGTSNNPPALFSTWHLQWHLQRGWSVEEIWGKKEKEKKKEEKKQETELRIRAREDKRGQKGFFAHFQSFDFSLSPGGCLCEITFF